MLVCANLIKDNKTIFDHLSWSIGDNSRNNNSDKKKSLCFELDFQLKKIIIVFLQEKLLLKSSFVLDKKNSKSFKRSQVKTKK